MCLYVYKLRSIGFLLAILALSQPILAINVNVGQQGNLTFSDLDSFRMDSLDEALALPHPLGPEHSGIALLDINLAPLGTRFLASGVLLDTGRHVLTSAHVFDSEIIANPGDIDVVGYTVSFFETGPASIFPAYTTTPATIY